MQCLQKFPRTQYSQNLRSSRTYRLRLHNERYQKKEKIAQEDPELVLLESDSTFTDIDDQMLDSYLVAVALVRFTL